MTMPRGAGPAFCTSCGAPIGGGWAFCPRCGAPVALESSGPTKVPVPGPNRPVAIGRAPVAIPVLIALAAIVTLVALFPAYYKGGHSLASNPENLWYNLLPIAGWLVAAVLLAFAGSAQVGAGLASASRFARRPGTSLALARCFAGQLRQLSASASGFLESLSR